MVGVAVVLPPPVCGIFRGGSTTATPTLDFIVSLRDLLAPGYFLTTLLFGHSRAMFNLLLADRFSVWNLDLWYAVPAIIAVSLVYAATRHERMRPILVHASRMALWTFGFMFLIFAVLELMSWRT